MKHLLLTVPILLLMVSFTIGQEGNPKLKIYDNWNECVTTLHQEWQPEPLWESLQESYKSDPPEYIQSIDRVAKLDKLIDLQTKRLQALKRMRDLEKR
jgi:hypothetical protein